MKKIHISRVNSVESYYKSESKVWFWQIYDQMLFSGVSGFEFEMIVFAHCFQKQIWYVLFFMKEFNIYTYYLLIYIGIFDGQSSSIWNDWTRISFICHEF